MTYAPSPSMAMEMLAEFSEAWKGMFDPDDAIDSPEEVASETISRVRTLAAERVYQLTESGASDAEVDRLSDMEPFIEELYVKVMMDQTYARELGALIAEDA